MHPTTITNEFRQQYSFIFSKEFRGFITDLLKQGGLNDRSIEKCTTDDAMVLFGTSFIHKSITTDASLNYEFAEIQGDAIVNSIIVNYITRVRFPKVVNVDWITRIKTRLISKRGLSEIARNMGMDSFIKISEDYGKFFEGKTEEEKWMMSKYRSLFEDTLEAFVGTLITVIDSKLSYVDERWSSEGNIVYVSGPGYSIATNFVYSALDRIKINLSYVELWDPVSRLKNLYDKKRWNFKRLTRYREVENTESVKKEMFYTFTFYACPFNNDRPCAAENRNTIQIGTFTSTNKTDAKDRAALEALATLAKYGIKDEPKKPFIRKN